MSTHADVTVVLTEPDKQRCSVKYKYWPVAIYKDKHYRPNEPNWFIAAPGHYFRSGDVMILIWYDGISVSNKFDEVFFYLSIQTVLCQSSENKLNSSII